MKKFVWPQIVSIMYTAQGLRLVNHHKFNEVTLSQGLFCMYYLIIANYIETVQFDAL